MGEEYQFRLQIQWPEGFRELTLPIGISIIGRDPDSHIHLTDRAVSHRHAQIHCSLVECTLTDLESTNGTFLDGKRIPAQTPVRLHPQAVIIIKPYRIVLERIQVRDAQKLPLPTGQDLDETGGKVEIEGSTPEAPSEVAPSEVAPSDHTLPIENNSMLPGLPLFSLRLIHYLPDIYRNDLMDRFLALFESLLLPLEWLIDNFDLYLDPRTAPADFLVWLANWVELARRPFWSEAQRRQLLIEAPSIYSRLGTRYALRRVLEIYTGTTPEIVEFAEGQEPYTFVVRIPLPDGGSQREGIEDLIRQIKPAHTVFSLEFVG